MAIPSWPSGVEHRPDPAHWDIVPFRPPLATDMEGGNTRYRRRPGDDVATMTWGQIFRPDEVAILRPFLTTTLRNCTSRFTMPVSMDGSTVETRVVQIVPGSLGFSSGGGVNTLVKFDLSIFPPGVTG